MNTHQTETRWRSFKLVEGETGSLIGSQDFGTYEDASIFRETWEVEAKIVECYTYPVEYPFVEAIAEGKQ